MNVHTVRNTYSTAYLVVEDKRAMLVDASTPSLTPRVLAKLTELGAELDLIVLTHFHYDHVGSADALRTATGAKVAIHHADAEALRLGGKLQLKPTRFLPRLLAPGINRTEQEPVEPDIELDDHVDLTAFGGFGETFHTPGHTPGSICVLLPDGTVFVGDALTAGMFTRRALGPMFVEDPATTSASIREISRRATRVLAAHAGTGEVSTPSLRKFAARQPN